MTTGKMAHLTEIGKALSDRNRIRALMALRKGELCLCQLMELLKLAPSTVSKHMSILKLSGLVDSRKASRWVYYRLSDMSKGNITTLVTDMMVDFLGRDETVLADDKIMRKIKMNHKADGC